MLDNQRAHEGMSMIKEWSPERVARMLHVSLDRVIDAIERGLLAARRIDGQYVISDEQLSVFTRRGNPFVYEPHSVMDGAAETNTIGTAVDEPSTGSVG